jgi:hypothetical protein
MNERADPNALNAIALDGICQEAIGLLKDKMCPMAVFDVLRKMNLLRQIEAAELLINANNFSVSYASAWPEHPKPSW